LKATQLCALAAAGVGFASASAEAKSHQLDLPPGSLAQAVIALGRQANVSIALASPGLGRIVVRGVRGRMSADEALRRLVSGISVAVIAVGPSAYRLVPAKPRRQARRPRNDDRHADASSIHGATIIVTASKRSVQIKDYPGGATVLTAADLTVSDAGEGTAALKSKMSSLGSTHLGPGRNKLFIRGIADSSFNGATQSTVVQYLDEARLGYNGPDPDLRLYDVASVELLPGPQGTLHGAGSLGGVLRVVPKAPDPAGAYGQAIASASLTAHGKPSSELAGILNLPLAPGTSAVRLVAYRLGEGGYIDDHGRDRKDVNDTVIAGGRAAAQWTFADDWRLNFAGAIQQISGRDGQYSEREQGPLARKSMLSQPFSSRFALGNATLSRKFGAYRFVTTATVSGQRLVENFDATRADGLPFIYRQRTNVQMTSLESRLSRDGEGGSGWVAGINIVTNRDRLERSVGPPGSLRSTLGLESSIGEQTLFVEGTGALTEEISLTAGARLSHSSYRGQATDLQTFIDGKPVRASEWRILPTFGLNIRPVPHLRLFVRHAEGYRPGGAILRDSAAQLIKSDRIAATEVGLRFDPPGEAGIRGALSASRAKWRDIQADLIDMTGLPSTNTLGDGIIWSLEGQIEWRLDTHWALSANGVLNKSRVTNRDPGVIIVDGASLPNVPDAAARAAIFYSHPIARDMGLRFSAWSQYVGKSRLGIGPVLERYQGKYIDSGAEVRLVTDRIEIFGRVTNLLGVVGNRFALGSIPTYGVEDQITPLRPRTVRLGLSAGF
jgi:outer membrane receptor protein involved in Fe transport